MKPPRHTHITSELRLLQLLQPGRGLESLDIDSRLRTPPEDLCTRRARAFSLGPMTHPERARAARWLAKRVKEAKLLPARGVHSLHRFRKGTLTFSSAGEAPRTFVIAGKLAEGGYSTIWRVLEWQPDGSFIDESTRLAKRSTRWQSCARSHRTRTCSSS